MCRPNSPRRRPTRPRGPPPRPLPRRRDPGRDPAAAGRVGYARLTMDAVAAEAGVGKATIYRRWRTKQDLVVDTISELAATSIDAARHRLARGRPADAAALAGRRRQRPARGGDAVAAVDDAARKDPDARHERGLGRAPHHQHLDPRVAVASAPPQQQNRRRWPRGRRLWLTLRTITCLGVEVTKQLYICGSCGFIYDPDEGDPGRRHPAGHGLRRDPGRLVLSRLRRPQGRLRTVRRLAGHSDGRVTTACRAAAPRRDGAPPRGSGPWRTSLGRIDPHIGGVFGPAEGGATARARLGVQGVVARPPAGAGDRVGR